MTVFFSALFAAISAFFFWMAWRQATKAAASVAEAKGFIVAWWRQAKPGMPIPHELQRRK